MIKHALIAACLVAAAPAYASRSCLDRSEAARTWPTKTLAVDGDGCFTYMRRGLKPVPIEAPATPVEIAPEVAVVLDMHQRWPVESWPTLVRAKAEAPVTHHEPLLTPRTVVIIIFSVAMTCAVFEVAFGGLLTRNRAQTRRFGE